MSLRSAEFLCTTVTAPLRPPAAPSNFHAAAIPTKNRIDEDARHRAHEGTVIRQSLARRGVGHCENELS